MSAKDTRVSTLKADIKSLRQTIESCRNGIATARLAGRDPRRAHAAVSAVAKTQSKLKDAEKELRAKQAELKRLS